MNLLRNTTYNIAGSGLQILVAIAVVPYLLGEIGPAKFGLLSLAYLIIGYFGVFDLGFGRAVAHRISKSSDNEIDIQSDIVSTAIFCNLIIGLIGGLVLWVAAFIYFSDFLNAGSELKNQMIQAIPILVISVPVTTITGVLSGSLEGKGRFSSVNVAATFAAVLFHLLPLVFAIYGFDELHLLILGACLGRIFGILLLIQLNYREFGMRARVISSEARQLFQFGSWVALSSLVGPLMLITDRFIIGALIGSAAIAVYTIPFEIAARTATIPQALGRALFPQISRAGDWDSALRLGRASAFNLAFFLTPITIIGIFAMRPFMDLWLKTYDPKSVLVGQISLAAFWVNALSYVPLTFIIGRSKPEVVAKVHCAELLPYLVLVFLLTDRWGVEGAAVAFLFRCVVDYFLLGTLSGIMSYIWKSHAFFAASVLLALIVSNYAAVEAFTALTLSR